MKNFEFELGAELRDTITGFTGVVVCRTQWLHGCNVYGLQPRGLEKEGGKPKERAHFDEPALELVIPSVAPKPRKTGGPEKPVYQTRES